MHKDTLTVDVGELVAWFLANWPVDTARTLSNRCETPADSTDLESTVASAWNAACSSGNFFSQGSPRWIDFSILELVFKTPEALFAALTEILDRIEQRSERMYPDGLTSLGC